MMLLISKFDGVIQVVISLLVLGLILYFSWQYVSYQLSQKFQPQQSPNGSTTLLAYIDRQFQKV